MKIKTYRQAKRYLNRIIIKEAIRRESDKNDSPLAFLRRTPSQKKEEDLSLLLDHLKEIPSMLYKYRACNEDNFKALENNELWLSSAENFCDPFDCRIPFSITKLSDKKVKRLMKWFVFSEYICAYNKEQLDKYESAVTPKEVRKIMFSNCYNDELIFNGKATVKFIKKHYPSNQHDEVANKIALFDEGISRRGRGKVLLDWFREDCEKGCIETTELIRKNHFVCSLTESNNNPKMWEEYADTYKGYCIGFDFSKGIRKDFLNQEGCVNALASILPVFYKRKHPKFNSYKFQLRQYQDDFYENKDEFWEPALSIELTLHDLVKCPEYSNEQEWRIIVSGEGPGPLWFPFFSSIYLGKDISLENKKRLLTIAEKLNLSIYQQKVGINGFIYASIRTATPNNQRWSGTITLTSKDLENFFSVN